MGDFFQFEADFVDALRCIPMQVRMKLDCCGVKLKLDHWHQFSQAERQQLVDWPCQTSAEQAEYRRSLQGLVTQKTGALAKELPIDPDPAWLNPHQIPSLTQQKAADLGVSIKLEQWANLNPLQRFALIKLSRPGHESKNFQPALQEFGLKGDS